MRKCNHCRKDIGGTHLNRKYCSSQCIGKARYKKVGQRSTAEQRSKWHKKRLTTPGYSDKIRQQGVDRYYIVQNHLRLFKLSVGCLDCGYKDHHAALEFDHVRGGKEINVCNAKSIAQANKEIKKCEVVCSNCHKIRTYNRLQKRKPDIFQKTYEPVEL